MPAPKPEEYCSVLTAWLIGEGCNTLSAAQSLALYTATFLLLGVALFITVYLAHYLLFILLDQVIRPQTLTMPPQTPTQAETQPSDGRLRSILREMDFLRRELAARPLKESFEIWRMGGIEEYEAMKRAEEEDRVFRERVAREGWESVERIVIPGWNCEEAKERERIQGEKMKMEGRDEEDRGGYGGCADRDGIQLTTLRSPRGSKMDDDKSDEEVDRQIDVESSGKGSSNSRHSATGQKLSQRKR